jgi:hypothetical protein
MASFVDIANAALSHLGADAVVAQLSPPDGSVEAGHCARFLPIARQTALASHAWGFARKRVVLALLTNDSEQWGYKYQLPSDCLRPRKILAADELDAPERNGAPFEREADALYTDEADAVLIYTRDITDPTKFTADFVSGLGMLLAGYLAGPIIKGRESISIGNSWTTAGLNALRSAAAREASATHESSAYTPPSISARA